MVSVLYHNPKCSTSRFVREVLELAGESYETIVYLVEGWSEDVLRALLEDGGLVARDVLRVRNTPAAELGLLEASASQDQIIAAMIAHPNLVERPILRTPRGVALCRPKERVFDLLSDQSPRDIVTEKGEAYAIPFTS
jgi:arsenate reductase